MGTTVCRTLESLPSLWKGLDPVTKESLNAETIKYWESLSLALESKNWIHNIILNSESRILNFSTSIYITPGYKFQIVDELITNFHLPESSLLVLVSAFIGRDETLALYEKAVEERYRFFSFGDGMYLRRRK